jgi:hypothetical protein
VILSVLFIVVLPFRFSRDSAYVLGVGLMLIASPFVGMATANALRRARDSGETARLSTLVSRFKACGMVAWILAIPVVGFASFFVNGLLQDKGGWNPNPVEAVLVPLTWLGAVLLPVCGWRLCGGLGRVLGCVAMGLVVLVSGVTMLYAQSRRQLLVAEHSARVQAEAAAVALAAQQDRFTPTMERVLPLNALGYSDSLNLDTDTLELVSDSLTDADWSSGISLPEGIVVIAATNGRPFRIACTGVELSPVRDSESAWERLSPAEIDLAYELAPGQTATLSGAFDLPQTFLFKTAQGSMGLLQIMSFTDNPRSVKLPYKRVQASMRHGAEPADLREARARLADVLLNYTPQHSMARQASARVEELERIWKEEPNTPADLRAARAQLAELRVDYSEQHPRVQQALARIRALEEE